VRRRNHSWVDGVIAALALVLLVTLVVALIAVAFPNSVEQIETRIIVDAPWLGEAVHQVRAAGAAVFGRAREGWEHRFAQPFRRLTGTQEPSVTPTPTPPAPLFPEEQCEECHSGFRERARFSVVYFSHSAHQDHGIDCARCHDASGPGRCRVPPMAGCTECHQETEVSDGCVTCHPPGTVFHGAVLAADREMGMRCETCHSPDRLTEGAREHGVPAFDTDPASCNACHASSFCGRCHPAVHPRSYVAGHVADFQSRAVVHVECYRCHSPAGCARCHTR